MTQVAAPRNVVRDAADVFVLQLVGVATLAGVIAVALKWPRGQILDEDILQSFRPGGFQQSRIDWALGQIDVSTIFLVTFACALVAVAQGHWRLAIGVGLLVAGANQTTQLLKDDWLTRGDGGPVLPVTMPSGHATAALSLAVAATVVAPRILRLPAVLGGGFVAGIAGLGTMAERWHRPADVVAAVGVVMAWAAIALVVGGEWLQRPMSRPAGFDRAVGYPAVGVVGVALAAWQLHRMGMGPMEGSRAQTLAYGSVVVVGVIIGVGVGSCAVFAERRVHRLESSPIGFLLREVRGSRA